MRLEGKTNEQLALLSSAKLGKNIGSGLELDGHFSGLLLDLFGMALSGLIVGYGCGHNHAVGPGEIFKTDLGHLLGGFDSDGAGGLGQTGGNRADNERYLVTPAKGGSGDS